MFSNKEKNYLLKLARSKIESELTGIKMDISDDADFISNEKQGCFVTLHKNNQLRGCIGTINPVMCLIEGIKDNAVSAALRDTRFSPLTLNELSTVKIEISVLSKSRELHYEDSEDLKNQIIPHKHGVILENGYNRSTFLPQVWEQLTDTEKFLKHLCLKAGMAGDCWRNRETIVKVYTVECFSE